MMTRSDKEGSLHVSLEPGVTAPHPRSSVRLRRSLERGTGPEMTSLHAGHVRHATGTPTGAAATVTEDLIKGNYGHGHCHGPSLRKT